MIEAIKERVKRPAKKKVSIAQPSASPARQEAKQAKPSFDEFVKILQKRFNEDGTISKKKHHPDVHYVGASPQCKLCSRSERSAKDRYEFEYSKKT